MVYSSICIIKFYRHLYQNSFFRFPICETTNGKGTTGFAGVVNKGLGLVEQAGQKIGLSADQVTYYPYS